MLFETEDPISVVKRAVFLAYEASSVMGLGILQARSGVTEDQVWAQVGSPNGCSSDYIFGRMVKLGLSVTSKAILVPSYLPDSNYQSWARTYGSFKELLEAAQQSLRV